MLAHSATLQSRAIQLLSVARAREASRPAGRSSAAARKSSRTSQYNFGRQGASRLSTLLARRHGSCKIQAMRITKALEKRSPTPSFLFAPERKRLQRIQPIKRADCVLKRFSFCLKSNPLGPRLWSKSAYCISGAPARMCTNPKARAGYGH